MDKKHACPECDRGFKNAYDVKKHIATAHLNLKSYRCTICNIFYAKGCNLNYHIGVRHMGMTEAESRKKCKLTKQHMAYEYTKPNEKLFIPFFLKHRVSVHSQQQQQQQQQQQHQQPPHPLVQPPDNPLVHKFEQAWKS